jgi:hypothetical protein
MWLIDNHTPFAADCGWIRDRDGSEVWLVVVKATFDIHPDGTTKIADDQPPVLRIPQYFGEPDESSVRYDTDLILTKPTTDIIVVGHAQAPGGSPVTALDAGFRVANVQKSVRVIGDRVWIGSRASAPTPFVRMPLVYERAFGGTDRRSQNPRRNYEWRNPVGTGLAGGQAQGRTDRLPNIENSAMLIRSPTDHPLPAGLGAIASHWLPRARYGGTYDDHWSKTRKPLLPDDFDERYFQCAPPDQQSTEYLRGNEPVILHNLTPQGTLHTSVPVVRLGFETRFQDGTRVTHSNRALHTVIIEPDYPRLSLVWHSALPCHFKVYQLIETAVTLKINLRDREREALTRAVLP